MTFVKCDADTCRWNGSGQCMRGQVDMSSMEFTLYGGMKRVEVQCDDYEEGDRA